MGSASLLKGLQELFSIAKLFNYGSTLYLRPSKFPKESKRKRLTDIVEITVSLQLEK
jgi:hypothetical protein